MTALEAARHRLALAEQMAGLAQELYDLTEGPLGKRYSTERLVLSLTSDLVTHHGRALARIEDHIATKEKANAEPQRQVPEDTR